MSTEFYIIVAILAIAMPSILYFAHWWNVRHGFDENGEPLDRKTDNE